MVLCTLAALLTPALAGARIVPGRGIADIRLNATGKQVAARLGRPTSRPPGPLGYVLWDYKRWALRIVFLRDHVVEIYTGSRAQRTRDDLGVGTKEATLRKRLHSERCFTHPQRGRLCMLGSLLPGQPFTLFELSPRLVVNQVVVGYGGAPS